MCTLCNATVWQLRAYIEHSAQELNVEMTPEIMEQASQGIDCFLAAVSDWLLTAHNMGFEGYGLDRTLEKAFADPPGNFLDTWRNGQ